MENHQLSLLNQKRKKKHLTKTKTQIYVWGVYVCVYESVFLIITGM